MEISRQRWKEANKVETAHWINIMSNRELADKEDGYYRHADVMLLTTDNPSGISVVDIGGGPLSLTTRHSLLKTWVVDPIQVTESYLERYSSLGTEFICLTAEDFLSNYDGERFDEVWMYNCLQHTIDPEYILDNLHRVGKTLRISEPTNTPINTAHPHTFTPEWYIAKLDAISDSAVHTRIDYDYPYVGGKFVLKSP